MDNRNFPTPPRVTEGIQKLVANYPGRYAAMAKTLDATGTADALSNRVHQRKGQLVPLGMAIAMEEIAGRHDITEAFCSLAGGVFIKLPQIGDVDNDELLLKFNNATVKYGELNQKFIEFTCDGELDENEEKQLEKICEELHQCIQEIFVLTVRYYKKS